MSGAFFSPHTVDKPWTLGWKKNKLSEHLPLTPSQPVPYALIALYHHVSVFCLCSHAHRHYFSQWCWWTAQRVFVSPSASSITPFLFFPPLCFYNCLVFLLLLLVSIFLLFVFAPSLTYEQSTVWGGRCCSAEKEGVKMSVDMPVCIFLAQFYFILCICCSSSGSDFRAFRIPELVPD